MATATQQTELRFSAPRRSIEQRFAEFDAANPHVFRLLEAHALRLFYARSPRIGLKALYEEVRGRTGTTDRGPSLNNDFTALYARKLIDTHPELAAVIETRARKGERRTA
jgi:hypothetical protein